MTPPLPSRSSGFSGELRAALPGLHLVAAVAIASRYLHGLIGDPVAAKAISEVLFAVLLGLWVRNYVGYSGRFEPGVKFALNRLLRLGIILLGLRLSLQDVVSTGASALLLILLCVTVALLMAYLMGGLFRLPRRLAVLIGVGTAICGNSAIVATAPVIEARDEDVTFAVATITLFGTLAVIVYPLVGRLLGLTDQMFGLWSGTAVNDTSMVVAASSAFSAAARDIATVVKLTRNTLMAPLIVLVGVIYTQLAQARQAARAAAEPGLRPDAGQGAVPARAGIRAGQIVPWFVLGFLLMALLRTLGIAAGVLPQNVDRPGSLVAAAGALKAFDELSKLAILMALSGIGLGTSLSQLRRIGAKPFVAGLLVAATLALVSLGAILAFSLGRSG